MSTPTEAHHATANLIYALAQDAAHKGSAFRQPCAQLLCDSEARAVEAERKKLYKLGPVSGACAADAITALDAQLAAARAECERLKAMGSWAHTCVHHTDADRKAGVSCPCCASAELARLRAELAATKKDNLDLAQWVGCKMMEPEWDSFKKSLEVVEHWKAIAKNAEAELAAARKEIEVLRWWGDNDRTAMADAELKGIIP